jgi:drug/metabolite transporter (DMT)-like permease
LAAIAVALAGLAFMFGANLDITHTAGMGIAFGVPVASALNIVLMKKVGAQVDLIPALAVGCVVSIAATLPFAWPLSTSLHDVLLLAFLGVVQLGIPCVMMVRAVAHLSAPEASVIDLLEIVFGVLWAWLAAGETPEARTLVGGLAVLAGVVLCEVGAGVTPRQVRI